MINEKELNIANTSYTNKDFGVIYQEILSLATQLSAKWTPDSTNESDPGIVLLKLLSFMGDKLNYNIDKNILECFMPSATQSESMSRLCEMMGYQTHYYSSATTDITFSFTGSELKSGYSAEPETRSITFPAFETFITDEDSSIFYILTEDCTLTTEIPYGTAPAIQGSINTFTVGDSSIITLDNIDNNNRLYFPESMIAENGVFIRVTSSTTPNTNTLWKRVTNLNIEQSGTNCYKISYDSKKKLPYIQFPDDIASLIGEGLDIHYIVTAGSQGNISAKLLNKISSPTSLTVSGAKDDTGEEVSVTASFEGDENGSILTIRNNSASTDGLDPEDINSAYNSFKKTVGTFNTLVTCRDYANAIYNLYLSNTPVVSNCQVGDRRVDFNYSNNITTYTELGQCKKSILDSDVITPYDLCLYPLQPFTGAVNSDTFKSSFKPLKDTTYIEDELESSMSISHNYKSADEYEETDIYLFKILYNLNAKITTTYKVNTYEASSIKTNIWNAIFKKFNPRQLDYGYEIPYDDLLSCIQNSDSRIKSVSLAEPTLSTDTVNSLNTSLGYFTDTTTYRPYIRMLGKNVLEGRVSLFEYDDKFKYEFGQSAISGVNPVTQHLTSFTSLASLSLSSSENLTVRDNEVVQLIGPSIVDSVQYSVYCNYCWTTTTDKGVPTRSIPANTDFKLANNEVLYMVYTDSNSVQQEAKYVAGDIVKSTFDIPATYSQSGTRIKKTLADGTQIECYQIGTSDTITKRLKAEHTFNSTISCSWIMSEVQGENTLWDKFKSTDTTELKNWELILDEGQQFIYSLDGETSYEVFGSGTSLRINQCDESTLKRLFGLDSLTLPDLDTLLEEGTKSLKSMWRTINFKTNNLILQQNAILSLSSGDEIEVDGSQTLNNTFTQLSSSIKSFKYKISGDDSFTTLDMYDLSDSVYDKWRIKSRLDLNAGPEKVQQLLQNQKITFKYKSSESSTETSIVLNGNDSSENKFISFKLNINLNTTGGENVSLKLNTTSTEFDYIYPFSLLAFKNDSTVSIVRSSGMYKLTLEEIESASTTGIKYELIPYDRLLVMVYVNFDTYQSQSLDISVTGSGTVGTDYGIRIFNTGNFGSTINLKNGMYILEIKNANTLTFIKGSGTGTYKGFLEIGEFSCINYNTMYVLNTRFNLSEIESKYSITSGALTTELLNYINEYGSETEGTTTRNIFYYNTPIDSSEAIEVNDLSTSEALFDSNNICNRFVLSTIDYDNSVDNIEIVRSSLL